MEIKQLKDCPQFAETVIKWLNDEFGNEKSEMFFREIVSHSLNENQFPITFAAVDDDKLVGTVGIWRGDLLSRQDLFPWLSALVVNPHYRNLGMGKKLQDHVIGYCKENNYKEIYLYTDIVGYYEKNNWVEIGKGWEYSGNEVKIYKHNL